jgi:SRSO17 transposase
MSIQYKSEGFLRPFKKSLRRVEHNKYFTLIVKGLLSDLDRKTIQHICFNLDAPETLRNYYNFMHSAKWLHEDMIRLHRKLTGQLLSAPGGMIMGDGCDFPKSGNDSVGVARQHCGPLGKTDNCQAAVFACY